MQIRVSSSALEIRSDNNFVNKDLENLRTLSRTSCERKELPTRRFRDVKQKNNDTWLLGEGRGRRQVGRDSALRHPSFDILGTGKKKRCPGSLGVQFSQAH